MQKKKHFQLLIQTLNILDTAQSSTESLDAMSPVMHSWLLCIHYYEAQWLLSLLITLLHRTFFVQSIHDASYHPLSPNTLSVQVQLFFFRNQYLSLTCSNHISTSCFAQSANSSKITFPVHPHPLFSPCPTSSDTLSPILYIKFLLPCLQIPYFNLYFVPVVHHTSFCDMITLHLPSLCKKCNSRLL